MTKEEVLQYPFKHSLDIQIRFNDLDINGHINNGVYHSYFDLGRVDFFKEILREKTNTTLIVQVNTTYVKSVMLTDTICIKNAVIRWGNSSFDMLQAIFRKDSDAEELVNYCVTTFVHIENGRPSSIPQGWKTAVERVEKVD